MPKKQKNTARNVFIGLVMLIIVISIFGSVLYFNRQTIFGLQSTYKVGDRIEFWAMANTGGRAGITCFATPTIRTPSFTQALTKKELKDGCIGNPCNLNDKFSFTLKDAGSHELIIDYSCSGTTSPPDDTKTFSVIKGGCFNPTANNGQFYCNNGYILECKNNVWQYESTICGRQTDQTGKCLTAMVSNNKNLCHPGCISDRYKCSGDGELSKCANTRYVPSGKCSNYGFNDVCISSDQKLYVDALCQKKEEKCSNKGGFIAQNNECVAVDCDATYNSKEECLISLGEQCKEGDTRKGKCSDNDLRYEACENGEWTSVIKLCSLSDKFICDEENLDCNLKESKRSSIKEKEESSTRSKDTDPLSCKENEIFDSEEGKCVFDWEKFWKNYGVVVGIGALILLVVISIIISQAYSNKRK